MEWAAQNSNTDLRRLAMWATWWMTMACSSIKCRSSPSLAPSHTPTSPFLTPSPKHSSHSTHERGRSCERLRRCARSVLAGSGNSSGFRAALRWCGGGGRGQTGPNLLVAAGSVGWPGSGTEATASLCLLFTSSTSCAVSPGPNASSIALTAL